MEEPLVTVNITLASGDELEYVSRSHIAQQAIIDWLSGADSITLDRIIFASRGRILPKLESQRIVTRANGRPWIKSITLTPRELR